MNCPSFLKPACAGLFSVGALVLTASAAAADEDAAKTLASPNDCFNCHGVDKK